MESVSAAMLNVALEYAKRGWAVLPVHTLRDGACTCGRKDCNSAGKHPWCQNGVKDATIDSEQIRRWWVAHPDANIGIRTGQESGIGVLDLDFVKKGRSGLERLLTVIGSIPETVVVKTGGGGEHHYFRLDGDQAVKSKAEYADLMGVDTRGTNGYVVAPPSLHASGRRYEWSGAVFDRIAPVPDWLINEEELRRNVQGQVTDKPEHPKAAASNGKNWMPVALSGLAEGNRNQTFTQVAGRLHQAGLSSEEIEALLVAFADRAGTGRAELKAIISSIARYPKGQSFQDSDLGWEMEAKGPIEVFGLQAFLDKHIPEQPWLVQGVIPACGIGLFAGQENLGKTWLVLDLALALASGRRWLGQHDTRKSKVLVIDEEGVPYFQQWRLKGMAEFSRLDATAMDFNLVLNQDIRFTHGPSLARLIPVLEEYQPDFVIVDSLVRVFGGDENSSQEVSRLFKVVKALAQKFQATFLFTDHHRKGVPGSTGWNQMVRGSSDKMAAVDFAFAVQKDESELVLHNTKARYSQRLEPFKVKLSKQEDGHVVVSFAGTAKDSRAVGAVLALMPVLEEFLPLGGSITRQEVVAAAKANGISEKEASAALDAMVKDLILNRTAEAPKSGKGNKRYVYQWITSTDGEAKP